ncbi:hypothetical protein ABFS82_07G033900 [Erythranthe guttata]|uniref:Bifunctional inhibitor/plant lipid transfer protein/seed storage helical domain-containing protein n=1 Tax=Erythranthe guttata TaxID=4155 RepID=A0A022RRD3_ERYGU|nr:PREDICTED: non-specific lipid-transfer protein-like protein At2g13820 [Erythranthe guttata]EYU41465.1 hypothetical protein MIMGU_mgv1a023041mg [Erythranthe guttata]|eukprot:XP_012832369.1 PREDICTED: non-specific lipid-transfer protein-like protein At2g13820 [Erythranthe guttata]
MAFNFLILALSIISTTTLLAPVWGQITTPCTPTMITAFAPCMNFVTNSSSNGAGPTAVCCNSLKSLMINGKDCVCLIATGSVPFQIPVNRTLALSLPRACNVPGVPLQCQAAASPVPAPGPVANGPSVSPNASPSPSVQELAPPESLSPKADEAPTATNEAPTSNTGRAGVTPSTAQIPYSVSPLHLMAVLGAIALNYYY